MTWKIAKKDERYAVLDNDELNILVPSITVLQPGKETNGHTHSDPQQEEVYVFTKGTGLMQIEDETFAVKPGDTIPVPANKFHKVYNTDIQPLIFSAIFNGARYE